MQEDELKRCSWVCAMQEAGEIRKFTRKWLQHAQLF